MNRPDPYKDEPVMSKLMLVLVGISIIFFTVVGVAIELLKTFR